MLCSAAKKKIEAQVLVMWVEGRERWQDQRMASPLECLKRAGPYLISDFRPPGLWKNNFLLFFFSHCFISLFLAVLCLQCCTRAFSSCRECELLSRCSAWASLVEHRLQEHGLQWLQHAGSAVAILWFYGSWASVVVARGGTRKMGEELEGMERGRVVQGTPERLIGKSPDSVKD